MNHRRLGSRSRYAKVHYLLHGTIYISKLSQSLGFTFIKLFLDICQRVLQHADNECRTIQFHTDRRFLAKFSASNWMNQSNVIH